MVLDLKKIFAAVGSSLKIDYEQDLSGLEYSGVFPLKKPVAVKGNICNRASVVSLHLEISYKLEAPCDRCGVETSKELCVKIDKALAVSIEGEDSDTIITVPGMRLDVEELVYSEVVLSFPTKILCDENCRGICCKCGKNLNEGACGCADKMIDPRLEKLAELLNND